jgi:hypothetical protein
MLREIEGVADEPRTRRRWFHDDDFDLFLWETGEGEVTLFQLCYGAGASERALVWHRDGGFFHDGAVPGPAVADPVIARFEAAAHSLPRKVRRVVSQRVREYLEGKASAASRRRRFRREGWQDAPGSRSRGEVAPR